MFNFAQKTSYKLYIPKLSPNLYEVMVGIIRFCCLRVFRLISVHALITLQFLLNICNTYVGI